MEAYAAAQPVAPGGLQQPVVFQPMMAPPVLPAANVPLLSLRPAPQTQPMQPWMEAKHPESGRVYFYNRLTQQSTFEKPEALKTPVERQLPTSQWREYVKEGKSYFVSSTTGQSVWEEPMEFTTHKQRLTAMCAGEAPTRDMSSLALYNAAKKALDECVVDVDGSLAKKQELAAQMAEAQFKRSEPAVIDLAPVDGRLVNPRRRLPPKPEGDPEDLFEQMLRDRKVPHDVTWDEALSVYAIPTDPRYHALPTPAARKAAFAAHVGRASEDAPSPENLERAFNALLDELVAAKVFGARTSYDMAVVMMRDDARYKALPEADAKALIETRTAQLRTAQTIKREEEEKRVDALVAGVLGQFIVDGKLDDKSKVSDGLQLLEGHPEVLAVPRLALRVAIKRFLIRHARRNAPAPASRDYSRGRGHDEGGGREARAPMVKAALALFESGAISVELRWDEFASQHMDKLPPDALLPLAGNPSAQERAFRDARDQGRQLVRECGYALRELNVALTGLRDVGDLQRVVAPEDVPRLEVLQRQFGPGIVADAVAEQAFRAAKEKEAFVQLLGREDLARPEVTWSMVVDAVKGRTAFREMSSNRARVEAWEELRANPALYKRDERSRRGGGGGGGGSAGRRDDRGRSKRRRT